MDDAEYIEQRLDVQKEWYSKNSQRNQWWHKRLQIAQILCAALIPFLGSVVTDGESLKFMTGALGVIIAIITGTTALYKFDEKWVKYRTTAEHLKHEKMLYLTGVEPYDGEDSFHLLVHRVETLISQENRDWSQYMARKTAKDGASGAIEQH